MNRKDKISLLKGIQSGTIGVDTLQPKLFRLEVKTIPNGGGGKYYINNKEVDRDTYSKEVVKNIAGDQVIIKIDGMGIKEWQDFMRNKEKEHKP